MRRVLVLGASGQLGSELVQQLNQIDGLTVYSASRGDPRHRFDLHAPVSVAELIAEIRPTAVFHAAAGGGVAWCEGHPEESWVVTVESAGLAATMCNEVRAKLVFFSTDYVFDGSEGRSSEAALPSPLNVYGRHKLAAEALVLATSQSNLVLRTCQLFGRDSKRRNFVYQVIDAIRTGRNFEADADLFGTPTWTHDLARVAVSLVLADESGTWHAAGEDYLSRYKLATLTANAFGLAADRVTPRLVHKPTDGVERPKRAGLTNGRLHDRGWIEMTPLKTALSSVAASEVAPK
jgi:dTDP-4-dehydrorhamnose reductase